MDLSAVAISAEVVCSAGNFKYWTTQLKEFIEKKFRYKCEMSHRAVQFIFPNEGVNLKVDLLVSPYWNTPNGLYQFLKERQESRSM